MTATPTDSFYWYDLETSGTDPRWHRIMQFAAIRTDTALNEVGDAFSTYVRLPVDVLPDPGACLVTGLTPQRVNAAGRDEIDALDEIERQFMQPRTCVAGFNSLRFDDEFIRYGFFRTLIDPYAREWQHGNSRWDVLDLARAAAALRPEGLDWPAEDGLPVFRLEALAAANGIEHGHAHDALADVRATIGLGRLIRSRQPRLFDYYLRLRDKHAVLALLDPAHPEVRLHVSGMVPRDRQCITPVMPIAVHPENRNAVIAVDLHGDIEPLFRLDADALRELLFTAGSGVRFAADDDAAPVAAATTAGATTREARTTAASDGPRLRIKEIRVNRCPFVAPMTALRDGDRQRLGWDLATIEQRFRRLAQAPGLQRKVAAVFAGRPARAPDDVDAALYGGFVADADRVRCRRALAELRSGAPVVDPGFQDARLSELLFRLRARNRAASLDAGERQRWQSFVRDKLLTTDAVPWPTLQQFQAAVAAALRDAGSAPARQVLAALQAHGAAVERWLQRPV